MYALRRQMTSPECANLTDDLETIFMTKFMLTHLGYFIVNLVLLLPKLTGHHRALHSTNAMIALWTISLGPLVKSCLRTIDCTGQDDIIKDDGSYRIALDSNPAIECWADNTTFWTMLAVGMTLLIVYVLLIPGFLLHRLWRESNDEADERWDAEFLEAHGWLVRTCLACISGSSAELTMTLFADSTIQT